MDKRPCRPQGHKTPERPPVPGGKRDTFFLLGAGRSLSFTCYDVLHSFGKADRLEPWSDSCLIEKQILAAGSLPTLISGAPIQSFWSRRDTNTPSLTTRESASSYTIFGGNGETSDGWPAVDQWKTFDEM